MLKYSHQLLISPCGRPVVAKLFHARDRDPTDMVCSSPIEIGDHFTLSSPIDRALSGETVLLSGIGEGCFWLTLSTGQRVRSTRNFTTHERIGEDYDGRTWTYTAYQFHGEPSAEVVHKNYWWHLFYSTDLQKAVVAEVAHTTGQTVDASYINYHRYPVAGDTFQLGYRFKQYFAGSRIRFLGVNENRLVLRGPDGEEFEHEYFHQRHGRRDGRGWTFFGSMFSGEQIVLTDQERHPENQVK